jgi:hypothetical protein
MVPGGMAGTETDRRPAAGRIAAVLRSDYSFIAGMVALAIVRNGFGVRPHLRFFAITYVNALPRVPKTPRLNQWALWSPLGPIVARLLTIHSMEGFVLLHLGVVIAGVAVLIAVRRQHGSLAMRAAAVAFVALPVSVVLQAWLGSYDAWVFLFTTLVVVTRSRSLAAVAGLFLAFANFDQGVVILVLLAVVSVIRPHRSLVRYVCAGGGMLVGRLVLQVWFRNYHVTSGRQTYASHLGLELLLRTAGHHWLLLVLSLVGAAYPLLFGVMAGGRRPSIAVLVVLIGSAVPMILATDETRVFALTSWPPLLALILDESARSPERIRRALRWTIALAVAVPGFFIWYGRPFLAKYQWIKLFYGS